MFFVSNLSQKLFTFYNCIKLNIFYHINYFLLIFINPILYCKQVKSKDKESSIFRSNSELVEGERLAVNENMKNTFRLSTGKRNASRLERL